MIIREANARDFPELTRLGGRFAEAAGQPDVDPESLVASLRHLQENGVLLVAEDDGHIFGVIGALVFPHYWNSREIVAQELFWFIYPEYRGSSAGIKLLDAAEKACAERGAKRLMMLCLDDLDGDKVAEIYRRRGYQPQERTFVKVL